MPRLEVFVILAVAAWLTLGLFVLLRLSKKYPQGIDWPPVFDAHDGLLVILTVVSLGWFVLWLFAWPLHAWYAPQAEYFLDALGGKPSEAAKHQLGLWKRLAVGDHVLTVTPLAPVGIVEHVGQRLEAQAQHGHIAAGQTVTVVGYYMKRAMVKA